MISPVRDETSTMSSSRSLRLTAAAAMTSPDGEASIEISTG